MFGWRVLTRPPRISFVSVRSATERMPSMPASVRCARVPSVAKHSVAGIDQAFGELDDAVTITDGEKGAQSTSS